MLYVPGLTVAYFLFGSLIRVISLTKQTLLSILTCGLGLFAPLVAGLENYARDRTLEVKEFSLSRVRGGDSNLDYDTLAVLTLALAPTAILRDEFPLSLALELLENFLKLVPLLTLVPLFLPVLDDPSLIFLSLSSYFLFNLNGYPLANLKFTYSRTLV